MKLALGGLALVFLLGCDPVLEQPRLHPYMAWEEGLTLGYIQPHLPAEEQANHRVQYRVAHSQETDQGRTVTLTISTLQSHQSATYFLRKGGVVLGTPSQPLGPLLPEGFPTGAQQWDVAGTKSRLVGYAAPPPGMPLPKGDPGRGVWVETQLPDGRLQRMLYLVNIGPAEVLEWNNGQWVSILRLVSRGFTDVPRASGS